MCWNYAVAAGFSVVESFVLLGVWWRNSPVIDRSNVLGFLPLVLQEAAQAALWLVMRPQESSTECSAHNTALSMGVSSIIHVLPLALAQRSTLRLSKATPPRLREVLGWSRRACRRWFWVVGGGTCVAMAAGFMAACTVKGPHGHQIWPLLLVPDPLEGAPVRKLLWIAYFFHLVAPVRLNPSHDICDLVLNIVGGPTVFLLWLYLGDEFGSAWCFLASALSLSAALAPYPAVYRLCGALFRCVACRSREATEQHPLVVESWPAPADAARRHRHSPGVAVPVELRESRDDDDDM